MSEFCLPPTQHYRAGINSGPKINEENNPPVLISHSEDKKKKKVFVIFKRSQK